MQGLLLAAALILAVTVAEALVNAEGKADILKWTIIFLSLLLAFWPIKQMSAYALVSVVTP